MQIVSNLFFPRKQDLTFHAKCLSWSTLGKIFFGYNMFGVHIKTVLYPKWSYNELSYIEVPATDIFQMKKSRAMTEIFHFKP